MPHAYSRNYVHIIFGTKGRRRCIKTPLQHTLWKYLAGICLEYGAEVNAIGGVEDHVHMLLCIPPKLSVAALVRALKANSSKWMNETGHFFSWQEGYACFSVSASNRDSVAEYVRNQANHHHKRTFGEEWEALLRKHGIESRSEARASALAETVST